MPTIEISSVNIDILTKFNIECSKFDQSFANEKKVKTLKRQNQVDNFLKELKSLTRIDDSTNVDIDTRAQILVKYTDHVEKICADRFSVYRNGTYYKLTDKLRKMIW